MAKVTKAAKIVEKDPEIEFCWAAFCKMILRDAMTGESSLIGLMPTMQVTLQLPEDHPDDKINIQIGPGAIMALFRSAEPAKQKTVLDLDVTLSFPGQRQEAKAQLEFKPGGQFCQVCMALAMVPMTVPTKIGTNKETAEIIWRLGNKELGRLKLPVNIEILPIAKKSNEGDLPPLGESKE